MQRLQLISDFNIEILGRYLSNMIGIDQVEVSVAPFGQVFQSLMDQNGPWAEDGSVLVWTRPESILTSYRKALYYEAVDHDVALEELDGYVEALSLRAKRAKYLFHATWTLPSGYRGYGMLDFARGVGLSHLLARMNLRLAESIGQMPNVFMLPAEQWIRHGGPQASIPKLWFAGKIPFKNAVFQSAASDLVAALNGLAGRSRKLVIVDLDNTLWGGVVGETGWRGLRLGGHDHVGEAFVEFQRSLKALTNRGVQLGIVSKNDEQVALEAIDCHPEMQLKRGDFAGWRIDWSDKVRNIEELAAELRLGIDSIVFIDDNPAERGRVREALGDRVLVPEWPADPADYSATLMALRCFDAPAISAEDRGRVRMYADERERRIAINESGSLEDWLKTLQIEVQVERLALTNIERASQLLNKTNQMNLSTRRLSEGGLMNWAEAENRMVWTFRVSDRYGDSGLTGIISIETEDDTTRIVDFLMSCRTMGRSVEEAMVSTAVEYVCNQTLPRRIIATFVPTDRNRPCLDFWRRSGFDEREPNSFYWEPVRPYPAPDYVKLLHCQSPSANDFGAVGNARD